MTWSAGPVRRRRPAEASHVCSPESVPTGRQPPAVSSPSLPSDWFGWLRRIWRPKPSARPPIPLDPNRTADFPSLPAAVTFQSGAARVRVGVCTTTGRYREHNEDNFYVPGVGTIQSLTPATVASAQMPSSTALDSSVSGTKPQPDGLFIVADGMGGQLAGEQASRLAVELIPKELQSRLEPDDDDRKTQNAIKDAVAAANREIIGQSHVMPEFTNMGTTVVLALFRRDRAYVAGIGDSRAYRVRGGRIEKLTRDHDLATALTDAGTIKPDEAEHHRFRNVLYLYLGSPDARDGPDEVRVVDVRPGDKFLLASDGLTGVVRDATLAEMIGRQDDPRESAHALVQHALISDSRDNVTCVVIHAE